VNYNDVNATVTNVEHEVFSGICSDNCVAHNPIGNLQLPISLAPATIAIQFTRNYNGQVDSVAVPLEPTTPWIVFTNSNYLGTSCGFPQFQPTSVRNRDIF
jgi:hypothetical protein